jgi:hypothetical protein
MRAQPGLGLEISSLDSATDLRPSVQDVVRVDDVELAPVERDAAPPVSARKHTAWLGWAAASALILGGGAHYLLADRPLQEHRERAELARVQRSQAHEAQISSLRVELERTRADLERANIEAAAQKSSEVEPAPTSESAAIERAETSRAPAKNPVRRSARRSHRPSGDASNAKAHGGSSRSKAETQATKTADSSQPLRGILSNSNDPLEGL